MRCRARNGGAVKMYSAATTTIVLKPAAKAMCVRRVMRTPSTPARAIASMTNAVHIHTYIVPPSEPYGRKNASPESSDQVSCLMGLMGVIC